MHLINQRALKPWSHLAGPAHYAWTTARFWLFKLGSLLSGKVPLGFSYWVGARFGDAIYYGLKRHSANAVSNMRRVLGEHAEWQVVKETTRDSFRNYGRYAVDFLRFPHLDETDIEEAIAQRTGVEHLDDALARGKGAIIVSGHFGNWDMAGALLGSTGLPLYAVADTFEPQSYDDLINGTRKKYGINIIKLETGSLKQIFTALKRNEIVFLLFDKPQPDEGVPVQFFGEVAHIPAGPAAIVIKTGAALMVGYCARRPDLKTFSGELEAPIEYREVLTGDKQKDIQAVTQLIVDRMEAIIRRHPDQWYMFRQMWPRTARHDAEIRRRRFWGSKAARAASHS